MINLTFYSFKEKTPKHDSDIVLLRIHSSGEYTETVTGKILYDWVEVDENGDHTGTYICYEENEETPDNCKTMISFQQDGWGLSEYIEDQPFYHWMYESDYNDLQLNN